MVRLWRSRTRTMPQEVENLDTEQIDPMDVTVFEYDAPLATNVGINSPDDATMPSLDDLAAGPDQFKLNHFGELTVPTDDLMDKVG